MRIVTCVGDSETYGLGLTRSEAWPYQLCVALDGGGTPTLGTLSPWSGAISTTGSQREHVGTNWTVRNAGISSDTSRGMKTRFATDVLGASPLPDFVVIMCGENDIYFANTNGACGGGDDPTYGLNYSPGGLKENIAWMVQTCRDNGIVPILATPTPHGTLEGCTGRWADMQGLLKWLGTSMSWMSTSESANTLGCILSDHYQAIYDGISHPAYAQHYPTGLVYEQDNIHPNAAGALVIAGVAKTAVLAATSTGTAAAVSAASLTLKGQPVTGTVVTVAGGFADVDLHPALPARGTAIAAASVSGAASLGNYFDLAAEISAQYLYYDLSGEFFNVQAPTLRLGGAGLSHGESRARLSFAEQRSLVTHDESRSTVAVH